MNSPSPKRKLRRKGKGPPGAVSAQPELSLRLHGIEIEFNNQTTEQAYAGREIPATSGRQRQLWALAFAPENAVSDDNRQAALGDLLLEFDAL